MSLTDIALAKQQLRVTSTAEDDLIQSYLDAAENYAVSYLDRNVYTDDNAQTQAQAEATTALAAAYTAYNAALEAVDDMPCGPERDDAAARAEDDLRTARALAQRSFRGMVVNQSFTQAVLLLACNWFVNREAVFTETATAIELPFGVTNLLFPFRAQLGV